MYFPKLRKLILTAGLLALGSFSGCSVNKSYLHCPSCFRGWKSSSEYAVEPVPATEYAAPHDSTAPVTPEVLLENVPRAAPQGAPQPVGPQLPEKPISVPSPDLFDTSELPNVEAFDDERSPGDAHQSAPAPGEPVENDSDESAAEAPIPEGLQSSHQNPSLLKRIHAGIPRIESRPVRATSAPTTHASQPRRMSASSPTVASRQGMNPFPDPISYATPTPQPALSRTILEHNHNYPYSRVPASELTVIKGRPNNAQAVSSENDASPYDERHASDFEFEFDTPAPASSSEPDPWPFRPAQE